MPTGPHLGLPRKPPGPTRHEPLSGAWRMRGLRLVDLGYHRRKEVAELTPSGRALPTFALFLFTGGGGRWATRRGLGELAPGDALLVRPGEWHRFDPLPGGHLEEHWATFDGPLAEQLVDDFAGTRNHLRAGDAADLRERCAELIADAGLGTADGACRAAAGLVALLARLVAPRTEAPPGDAVDRWLALAAERPAEPPPVAAFLAAEGLAADAFRKRCQRRHGRGPQRLWAEARLAHARRLLRGSALPVAAVGRTLGFADPARFAQWFRRLGGVSPSTARRAR